MIKKMKNDIKFTARPSQKTRRYSMIYESSVKLPEIEEKMIKIAKLRKYGNYTIIIKYQPVVKGTNHVNKWLEDYETARSES